jgi:hypothetical protein
MRIIPHIGLPIDLQDAFDVKVVGDQLSVWRVDTQGGWGQQLELHARQASPLQDELQEM